jgi:hypothetical protein
MPAASGCLQAAGAGERVRGARYFLLGLAAAPFAASDSGSVSGKKFQAGLFLRKVRVAIPTAPGPGGGADGSACSGMTLRNAVQAAVGPGPNSRVASCFLRTSSQRVPLERSVASSRNVSSTAACARRDLRSDCASSSSTPELPP